MDALAPDVNRDGKSDLVVSTPDTNNFRVLLGDGAGGFTNAAPVPAGAGTSQFELLELADANTGGSPTGGERDALVAELTSGAKTRAGALKAVVENAEFSRREFNRAFELAQYFGYLRRGPSESPDTDFSGFNFWLGKLNEFDGNYIQAEMIKAFITSTEYRRRFGPQ